MENQGFPTICIEKIIDHYEPNDRVMNGKVIDLKHYKLWMNLE